jgi:hypothetical protein
MNDHLEIQMVGDAHPTCYLLTVNAVADSLRATG